MKPFVLVLGMVLAVPFPPGASAQQPGSGPPYEATPQRSSFTHDANTTAPGTLEIEFGALGPASTFTLPSAVKFTPLVERGLFHGMEFALDFDSLERIVQDENHQYKFGSSLEFSVRRAIWRGGGLAFAISPSAEFLLRDDKGTRLGGTLITNYGFGLNSLAFTFAGTAATSPSESNPEWELDMAYGYGRSLGESGAASRFGLAFEFQNEFPSGGDTRMLALQSLTYRARPNIVLDVGMEQHGLLAGEFMVVFRGGLTYNVGRLWGR